MVRLKGERRSRPPPPTDQELEQLAQRRRDEAAGIRIPLGNGGAWRRRCRPAE
ncbi:hypothetical protein [uncultured Reyranella sp.]|uniref:hypothetical protein n=1 Tax=uncultured Reyranella sp. TaxID=735512 RepID=UPI00259D29A2|nr:hypothetical protein [uncultured Reyranella sp.]